MDVSESGLTCCGLSVLIDGSCQHRFHHPRQITPEMVLIASYAIRHGSTEAKVRAVLEAVL